MLNTGSRFFIQIADSFGASILHPASVLETVHGTFTAVTTGAVRQLEVGAEGLVYFDQDCEFMQQPIRIEAIMPDGSGPDRATIDDFDLQTSDELCVFAFEKVGDPVSAEQRQCFRVSTVMYPVVATIDGEERCDVLDVSATGFSVLASNEHAPGAVLDTILLYDAERFEGKACVQNVRPHHSGRVRLGLYGIKSSSSESPLEKGCRSINTAVQRIQLRRMTGTD